MEYKTIIVILTNIIISLTSIIFFLLSSIYSGNSEKGKLNLNISTLIGITLVHLIPGMNIIALLISIAMFIESIKDMKI